MESDTEATTSRDAASALQPRRNVVGHLPRKTSVNAGGGIAAKPDRTPATRRDCDPVLRLWGQQGRTEKVADARNGSTVLLNGGCDQLNARVVERARRFHCWYSKNRLLAREPRATEPAECETALPDPFRAPALSVPHLLRSCCTFV
jgi:hypothetical protein